MPDQLIDYEGSLLDIDNSLTDDEDCCCDQPGDCCSEVTAIEVTISGLGDFYGNCTCSALNVKHTITLANIAGAVGDASLALPPALAPVDCSGQTIITDCVNRTFSIRAGIQLSSNRILVDLRTLDPVVFPATPYILSYSTIIEDDCCTVDSTGRDFATIGLDPCQDASAATMRIQTVCADPVAFNFYNKRKSICHNCKFFSSRGCSLYLKPCTVKQLWADQIDPPSQCPNKEKFYD